MSMFSKLRAARDTLYSRVWHNPKGRLSAKLRKVCDGMPHGRRITVVSVMLTLFVLTAFFMFGHACYRIGLGHSRNMVETGHISTLELPSAESDVKPLTLPDYDNAGMESED